jgi:branched-chain amino acid transport system permease protein
VPLPREPSRARLMPAPDRKAAARGMVIAVLVLLAIFALPPVMNGYYTDTMTQVAIYSVVALGLGLLVGRVGLYSLGQVAVLTIGAWAGARLLFATSQPYLLVLLEAGLATMVIGGGGFSGYNGSFVHIPQIRRPSLAGTDPAYYRYCVIIAIVMFLLVFVHLRSRPGRAWAAIRQSELAALAAGINTMFYKLWALALASFVTGVAGALLAGADRELFSIDFPIQSSVELLAVVLMGGVFTLWGAVVAAFLLEFLPALLQDWGVPNDWLIIIFGVGVLQVLVTAPRGLADQFPRDVRRLGALAWRLAHHPGAARAGAAATSAGASTAPTEAAQRD